MPEALCTRSSALVGNNIGFAPGDVVKVESLTPGDDGFARIQLTCSLFPATTGSLVKPQSAKVLGTVVSEGRGDKILVFHFKRKKQYKKLQGHRRGAFTQIRISEIQIDGQTATRPKAAERSANQHRNRIGVWHIKKDLQQFHRWPRFQRSAPGHSGISPGRWSPAAPSSFAERGTKIEARPGCRPRQRRHSLREDRRSGEIHRPRTHRAIRRR